MSDFNKLLIATKALEVFRNPGILSPCQSGSYFNVEVILFSEFVISEIRINSTKSF